MEGTRGRASWVVVAVVALAAAVWGVSAAMGASDRWTTDVPTIQLTPVADRPEEVTGLPSAPVESPPATPDPPPGSTPVPAPPAGPAPAPVPAAPVQDDAADGTIAVDEAQPVEPMPPAPAGGATGDTDDDGADSPGVSDDADGDDDADDDGDGGDGGGGDD